MPCDCAERPMCEWRACTLPAHKLSLWQPRWRDRAETFVFTCLQHWELYFECTRTGIPGITRPANADEDWRPSIMDMARQIAVRGGFKKLGPERPIPFVPYIASHQRNYTPQQWATYHRMQELRRMR